jgi:mono/diheme cytochrome c family protein
MSIFATRCVACLLLLGCVAVSFTAEAAESNGQVLFEKRCAACHKLPDPAKPPDIGWEQQLNLMAPLARLKKDQREEVLAYMLSHTRNVAMSVALDEDRMLFENKCSRCHTLDRILLSRLEGDDLSHVVNRMQDRSGSNWISDDDVARVLAYLGEAPKNKVQSTQAEGNASAEQLFLVRCSACHSLERVYRSIDADVDVEGFWGHTVSRMRNKAPQWMSDAEARQILDYLRSNLVVEP